MHNDTCQSPEKQKLYPIWSQDEHILIIVFVFMMHDVTVCLDRLKRYNNFSVTVLLLLYLFFYWLPSFNFHYLLYCVLFKMFSCVVSCNYILLHLLCLHPNQTGETVIQHTQRCTLKPTVREILCLYCNSSQVNFHLILFVPVRLLECSPGLFIHLLLQQYKCLL